MRSIIKTYKNNKAMSRFKYVEDQKGSLYFAT
jgi:hypothetical protein